MFFFNHLFYSCKKVTILIILIECKFCFSKSKNAVEICIKLENSHCLEYEMRCSNFENALHLDIPVEPSVTILSFSKNKITQLNGASFPNRLDQIEEIYLNHNNITSVDSAAFNNLPNLRIVDLSHNNLYVIEPTTFSLSSNLEIIRLDSNGITSLSWIVFQHLSRLKEVDLSSNPLLCDAQTEEVLLNFMAAQIMINFSSDCELIDNFNKDLITSNKEPKLGVKKPFFGFARRELVLIGGIVSICSASSILLGILLVLACKRKGSTASDGKIRTVSGTHLLNEESGYLTPTISSHLPVYLEVYNEASERLLIDRLNNLKPDLPSTTMSIVYYYVVGTHILS